MYKKHYIIIFIAFICKTALPQKADSTAISESRTEDIIESLAERYDEETDLSEIAENLENYRHHPINLNKATAAELEKLGLLSDFQIQSLIDYRKEHGNLLSIYELQYVVGYTEETVRQIQPYVSTEPVDKLPLSMENISENGHHSLLMKTQQYIEKSEGYKPVLDSILQQNPNSRFLGSQLRLLTKYRFDLQNRILAGFTLEKDPGEEFFRGSNSSFDFISGHLMFKDLGHFKSLVFGDFQVGFGQGITCWSGMAIYKSRFVMDARRSAPGITPYSSTDENHFLRGVAATVNVLVFDITAFYSHKNIDATISYDSITHKPVAVSYLPVTGLHTIPSELNDKHKLSETYFGGNISINKENYRLGVTATQILYGIPIEKNLKPYNYYTFNGTKAMNAGIDYLVNLRYIKIFSEAALSNPGGKAYTFGISANPVSDASFIASYRHFDPGYFAPYGNAFCENTTNANETGMYFGIEINPLSNLKLGSYADFFRFPWLKYMVNAPSQGYEYLVQADYKISLKSTLTIRYSSKTNDINFTSPDSSPDIVIPAKTDKLRIQLTYKLSYSLEMHDRLELSYYSKENDSNDKGYFVFHDIIWKIPTIPITLSGRYGLFDTDSYDSRIYAYEDDLLYSYSVLAFSGSGYRTYLMVKYSLKKHLEFWLRYGLTAYNDRNEIGDGLNKVMGNKKSDIRFQTIINF
jgi:hypothetical protein